MRFDNPLIKESQYHKIKDDLSSHKKGIRIANLTDAAKAHIVSAISEDIDRWHLIITGDDIRCEEIARDLSCFSDDIYIYQARDILFFDADIASKTISDKRMTAIRHLIEDKKGYIVTTSDALLEKIIDRDRFIQNIININKDDKIDQNIFIEKLVSLGYERCISTEDVGQFAIRGGIIDIYPMTESMPVRIELWDDTIDSMRTFDITSQRSIEEIDSIKIYPACEDIIDGTDSLISYFDIDRDIIVIDEIDRVENKIISTTNEFADAIAGRIESGQLQSKQCPAIFDAAQITNVIAKRADIYLYSLDKEDSYCFDCISIPSYRGHIELLIEDLKKYTSQQYKIIILTTSHTRITHLADNIREYGLKAYAVEDDYIRMPHDGEISVAYGNLTHGFIYTDIGYMIISESDIYGTIKKKVRRHHTYEGAKISSLSQLSIGDYIVHEDHGLGIYRGIEKIEKNNIIKDYIKIEYKDGDKCYIPATGLDIIQKYASSTSRAPQLSKIGSNKWQQTKKRVKSAVKEIAKELIMLYAQRLSGHGTIYGPDTVWQREFEEMFAYEETDDQLKAIEDVKSDMQQGKIMDRLICGDVGYGKTEIALRAAFKAVEEGKQVIYLVPTTILAQQHYNTFVERFRTFPVTIELMCRFRTKAQQKVTLDNLSKGAVDIVIGTHRLLSKDIKPKDLGLLIIDEEQRFGVAHKERLKELRKNVDVLTLTATPIPRTLHMSLAGIRDMSILEEPPQDRRPIQTYVMEYHDEIVREAIKREVARGGQVYYVYNRVDNISELTTRLSQLLPDISISYAHGQMSERELEDVMMGFINGDIDVLVTTTIIETGLDIPNVNTMIIQDADRFGLSQLYQLRGRVGRSSRTAYAFLLYRRGKIMTEEANKRLKAIKEFTELGSGIKIAMRDLEIRGAGDVLGARQSGHMQEVGYDLYCKLLNQAVKSLKNNEDEENIEKNVTIDADVDAFIPDSYISNEEQKLDIYKRISQISSDNDYMDMQDELIDRYGKIPISVSNLLAIAIVKCMAQVAFASDIAIERDKITVIMYDNAAIDTAGIQKLIDEYAGKLYIMTRGRQGFVLKGERARSDKQLMDDAMDFARKMKDFLAKKPENP